MIKCKKCGSSNVKVIFDTTYTIFPLKYGYKCQDCGEMDYMSCEELLKNLSEDNTFPNCRELLKNLGVDNTFSNNGKNRNL
jgi:ssDNA-binding Zn-finger/Zn-ribbon topoisomerase 1